MCCVPTELPIYDPHTCVWKYNKISKYNILINRFYMLVNGNNGEWIFKI